MFYFIMPLFLSHVAIKIWGLCSVYIVYGAKAGWTFSFHFAILYIASVRQMHPSIPSVLSAFQRHDVTRTMRVSHAWVSSLWFSFADVSFHIRGYFSSGSSHSGHFPVLDSCISIRHISVRIVQWIRVRFCTQFWCTFSTFCSLVSVPRWLFKIFFWQSNYFSQKINWK